MDEDIERDRDDRAGSSLVPDPVDSLPLKERASGYLRIHDDLRERLDAADEA